MGAFFVILIGLYPGRVSGRVSDFFNKIRTRPGSASGFFLKTHTRPYSLSGRVKSGPLGSGRTGYPRIGSKLPSLCTRQMWMYWWGRWHQLMDYARACLLLEELACLLYLHAVGSTSLLHKNQTSLLREKKSIILSYIYKLIIWKKFFPNSIEMLQIN